MFFLEMFRTVCAGNMW